MVPSRVGLRFLNQGLLLRIKCLFNSLETTLQPEEQKLKASSSVLLDVSGMICGGCVSRFKSVISSEERVELVVVNLLTETAAIKLKQEEIEGSAMESVAESIAQRVSECGFAAKRRVFGLGIGENVKRWKEMMKRKDELLIKSRNRVVFAWTLVALCCGAHGSHILRLQGIHIGHGLFLEVLHNSCIKDLLVDGLMAFKKGSPNMNSLVGFGSVAAFIISAVSLLNPELQWDATFFDEPAMLLGFVLLGRSLEEKAKIRASSDMNELLSLLKEELKIKTL